MEAVPTWLTKPYLQNILQNTHGSAINVIDHTIEPAVSAGNNYASSILRVQVNYSLNGTITNQSLIIKTIVNDENTAKMLDQVHTREMKMYSDILQKIQKSTGNFENIGPKVIFIDYENKAMILEDLKKSQYKVADRKIGMDWDHMKIVIRKLAKLHGFSMILAEQGEKFEKFQKGYYNDEDRGQDAFTINSFIELGEAVMQWDGYEKYGQKLTNLSEIAVQQAIDAYKGKKDQSLVLNHGDCQINNMMFKYNDQGHVEDSILVDFQYSNIASPISDLLYFFYTSSTDDIKFDHTKLHEVLKLYHEHLSKTLAESSVTQPTLFELHQQYYQREFMAITSTVIFAVLINDATENTDIATLIGDTEISKAFRRKMYNQPRFVRTVKHFLPLWDSKGLLDALK